MMKTKLSLFLILAALFIGCTHNHFVRSTSSANYASLNERGRRHQAIITLANGRELTAYKLRFAPDSTSWVDPHTQRPIAVQTAEVSNIRFVSRGKGALEGFGLGLLIGALSGAMIGLAGRDYPEVSFTAEEKALLGGIAFGALGGSIGLPVGRAVGSKDIYRIELESPQSTTRKSSAQLSN